MPDFTRAGWQKQRTDAQLRASIVDGKGIDMPGFRTKISGQQASQLVAYIRTMGGRSKPEQPPANDFDERFRQLQEESRQLREQFWQLNEQNLKPPASSEIDASATAGIFGQYCQKCHSVDGTGNTARNKMPAIPDFTKRQWQQARNDAQILESVLDGKGADMPAFREKISSEQARTLVDHIRKFGAVNHPAPAAPAEEHPGKTTPPKRAEEAEPRRGQPEATMSAVATEPETSLFPQASFPKPLPWVGKFHAAAVHFPIALMLSAAAAEFLLVVTGRPVFDATSRVCVWFGALTGVLAATLGWFLAGARVTDANEIMTVHRWLGTSTVVLGGFVLLLSELSRGSDRLARRGFRIALLLNAVLLLATGFFGGALVHSLDYYAWPP